MFLGHFGVAFAAKRAVPAVSLGTLFAAGQLADLAWPVLVLAGIETVEIRPGVTTVVPLDFVHYPYSHSLVALLLWGIAFGLVHKAVRGGGWRTFAILAALVVSHWFLDVAVHRPDMPIGIGEETKLGLGTWNSLPATLAVELVLFGACLAIYARSTRAVDRIGTWALRALVVFLMLIYAASVFGPPPPSAQAIGWSGLAMWLLVAWGWWIDRHRTVP